MAKALSKVFSVLTPTDFELFCRALLHEMGFQNLHWRTGGRDRGRDIVGEFIASEPDGTKVIQTWFVECKHFGLENTLSVADLQTKVAWADAEQPDYLLIITSSYLSADSKDWVEMLTRQKRYRIRYWEASHLLDLLQRFPSLRQIYLEDRSICSDDKSRTMRITHELSILEKELPTTGPIVLEEILGGPPDRLIFGLKFEAVVSFDDKDQPVLGSYHRLMISLPEQYPHAYLLPNARLLTPIMNPHVYRSGLICYGFKDPFQPIVHFVKELYSILSYESVNLRDAVERDPRLLNYLRQRKSVAPEGSPKSTTA